MSRSRGFASAISGNVKSSEVSRKPADDYSLPVLRNKQLGIDHAVVKAVAQLPEGTRYDHECPSAVMPLEVFHVLKEERLRLFLPDYPDDIIKQCALRLVLKPVRLVQTLFFETPAMENGWHGNPAQRRSKSGISEAGMPFISPKTKSFAPKLSV